MDGGIRDWLAGLSRREIALLSLLGLAALGGGGLWYLRSLPEPVAIAAAPAPAPSPTAESSVIVHVAGWVRDPGVYELAAGARVVDAIQAAGGPKRGALLSTLNLAALLTDAQQIVVPAPMPKEGVAAPPPVAGTAPTPGAPLVNVNTATPEELETLPGIGPVLAGAIVQYREENGPFTSVDQLIEVSGIGEVTMEELRDLVTI